MKNILLTWHDSENLEHFGWFENEDEVKAFIESNDIQVDDAIEILNSRELEL